VRETGGRPTMRGGRAPGGGWVLTTKPDAMGGWDGERISGVCDDSLARVLDRKGKRETFGKRRSFVH
jgi:hypothetical protein